ncbi:MAG: hypothetical protein ACXVKL_16370, partial [Candidatus Angelobacter sp.]
MRISVYEIRYLDKMFFVPLRPLPLFQIAYGFSDVASLMLCKRRRDRFATFMNLDVSAVLLAP